MITSRFVLALCAGGLAAASDADTRTYRMHMDGSQEVPGPGDPDGSATGTITLDDATGEISWEFTYADIDTPTAMHIHVGIPGVSGGIQIGLTATGAPGTLSDSIVHPNLAEVSAILDNPFGFYVNVHNGAFPGGAVRGNLGQIPVGDITVRLTEVASGLTAPVMATHAGDGSGRLFVVDQAGTIRIIDNGVLLATPFLDLTGTIVAVDPGFDERGVLGLAFHPDYANNGRFFVRYSAPRTGAAGEPCFGTARGCHTEVLAEFGVSGDPNVADPTPTVLYESEQPQFNHDAGHVAFGPDGLLYFSLGDGGGAHDGLADVPPSHGPLGHGQDITTALGSMLRIDVDGPPDPGLAYSIPGDNPFVGVTGVDEIYAYGLRNPYRFSFDSADGRLFVADVGQNLFEEVNVVVNGGNYGWVTREGFHCFDPFDPPVPPAACPSTGPNGEPLLDPVSEYTHLDGTAIIGGHVYRGDRFPALEGMYVHGDFSTVFFTGAGRLFYFDADGDARQVNEFQTANGAGLNEFLFGFGEDEDGELYVLSSGNLAPVGTEGKVYRISCPANWNDDTVVNTSDFLAYLNDYNAVLNGGTPTFGDPDLAVPLGTLNTADFLRFLNLFNEGCD